MSNVVFCDGIVGYVTCGVDNSLNVYQDLTLGVWIKSLPMKPTGANYVPILARGVGDGYEYGIYYNPANGIPYLQFTKYGIANYISSVVMPRGRPIYLALTFNFTTGNMRFYLDGNLAQTIVAAGALISALGRLQYIMSRNTASPDNFSVGLLYGVHIYNRELSSDEISYNWMHPNNPKRRGLVLNLTQDSIYGPQWNDLSGNANNGTYVGGAVPVTANRLAGR